MAQCLQGALATSFLTDDEDSVSEDDASPENRRCNYMKSGRLCTRDSHMLHRVKWPHEVVVCSQGKPPVYEDISLPLFSNGNLSVVLEENPVIQVYMLTHLRQIFKDVAVYRWGSVQEYHMTWLQLLEQGQATWSDEQKRA